MTDAAFNGTVLPTTPSGAGPTARQVASVVAGNALEFYDFLTYSLFAVQIGQTFFPSSNPASSLLASLGAFGAGFLTRPIGAIVIGRFGDRAGRKPAMLLTFALMGLSIVGLALTPSFQMIGIAAPITAIAFRLAQGFALGGEVGPSTAYLIEAAPPGRRGLYVSLQYQGQGAAILCAGLIGVALNTLLDAGTMRLWGWRIAFLAGATIVPFGLAVRRGLVETLHQPEAAAVGGEVRSARYLRVAVLGLFLLASGTTVTYVLTYMTTYAASTLHMPIGLAFGASAILGLTTVVFCPLGGWLSDRFGRKPVMMVPWATLAVLAVPCFSVIAHLRSQLALFSATALMAGAGAIGGAAMLAAITESLPKPVRSATLALVYALAIAIFGGSAQFNVAWLTGATHNPVAPAWYMVVGVCVGLVAMAAMRETAPARR